MKQPSFLARKTLGQPNYFLIAMVAVFLVALIPRGSRKAIESNTNKAEDWLPPTYAESLDLQWFRDHFVGEQFALISWDGCTLGNTQKLEELTRKLVPSQQALSRVDPDSPLRQRAAWYKKVITGPDVLAQLVEPPLALDYSEALKRIEGALVGPPQRDEAGESLGADSRTTCLMVYLSEEATSDNKTMRAAIENIVEIAATECAIDPDTIHMGGPPVDNITIDKEGEATLVRLASLSGIVGISLSFWCFRSFKLTGIVFAVGVLSAGMSLAFVFYFGALVEVWGLGMDAPRLGTVDAILMSMPAVVYVLGLSGAIHIVNYYRDARREGGLHGAAEAAVRFGWAPCTLAAFTTAVGLGSLYTSDILPIKKFGMFTAIAVMGTVAVLFTVLPVFLHRFPISEKLMARQSGGERDDQHLPEWARKLFGFVVGRYAWVCLFWMVVMGTFAYGFTMIGTEVQLLKLLDEDTDLIHDYAWLEQHLGNLVPMEVVLTVPPEKIRSADEHAEQDGLQYRMTMLERLNMMREIQRGFEQLPEISRVMSVATFTPESTDSGYSSANRGADYVKNKSLEEHRDLLLEGDYLRIEQIEGDSAGDSERELWRLSARVAALNDDGDGVDYGEFVDDLKAAVNPVLMAYQQRDQIVRTLHENGKKIDGSQLCILYRTTGEKPDPAAGTLEDVLKGLLLNSGLQPKKLPDGKQVNPLSSFNLRLLDENKDNAEYLEAAIGALKRQDALILVSAGSDPTAKFLAEEGLLVIDVTDVPKHEISASTCLAVGDCPRPIRAVYTGMVPVVYKTQRELLKSLNESIFWATVLISVVLMFVLKSPLAGIISMIPNMFPIVIIFGALGWLGIKVDIGIMMTASVALGVAVDDTIHFLTWFRRGIAMGLGRRESVMLSYDRCATAMTQTTLIGGLGLAVFATSTFTPTQQFGYLMISMLGAALVGDLLLLPALLMSPLGYFFSLGTKADNAESIPQEQQQEVRIPPASQPVAQTEPAPETASSETESERELIAAVSDSSVTAEQLEREVLEGPHAALHAKLRNLRRELPQDHISS